MKETFALPAVGAIIVKKVEDDEFILVQNRKKNSGDGTDGLLEIPAGKVREYENIFEALRREVWEETGLRITSIQGENDVVSNQAGNVTTISFEPYCVTQNVSGAYSMILHTFLCEAEGNLLTYTDEAQNIRWEKIPNVKRLIKEEPEKIFFMHLNALKKYVDS